MIVDADAAQCGMAEPEHFEGFGDAGMSLARNVAGQRSAVEALAAHVLDRAVARRGKAEEIGHRTAGDEQASGGRGKVEPSRHPIDDAFFHVNGAMIAAAAIRVHRCRRHFGEQAAGGATAMDPAPEARMSIARAIGQDQVAELGANRMHPARQARRRLSQVPLHGAGHRRPYRPIARVLQTRDQPVQKRVSIAAKGLPIGGIERRMRSSCCEVAFRVSHVDFLLPLQLIIGRREH